MSYDLDIYFEPPVQRSRILQYFAARKHYRVEGNNAVYKNMDTGVYFFMQLRCGRSLLSRRNVVSAAFEINYSRPSFFGTEAEIELSNFVTEFRPRIHDPQKCGMGEGPYSGEGFLNGWNFGNMFGVRVGLSKSFDLSSMPADTLRAAWAWNYHLGERKWRNPSCFVPTIMFFRVDGRPSRVVVWGEGMPVLLPKVDYVLVGRQVSGEPRFGLAPWSEVEEVVRRAGFDFNSDPLKLAYFRTPGPIADWVANVSLIDPESPERLRVDEIVDDELIVAASRSIEKDKSDPSIMTVRSNS